MRNFIILLSFLVISNFYSFSREKKVKVDGVVYVIDIDKRTASVGHNYIETLIGRNIKGTAQGDIVIASSVTYRNIDYLVTSIEPIAFLGCDNLHSIFIPNSINKIDDEGFNNIKNLKQINVAIDNPYFQSNDGVLFNKEMTKILRFPENKIEAFYSIPPRIITINKNAFGDCKYLGEILIPPSVKTIGEDAFRGCFNLRKINISNGVVCIKNGAFSFTKLSSVYLPFSVTEIGEEAFNYCQNLTSVVFQNKDLFFPKNIFNNCPKLTSAKIVYEAPTNLFLELANEGNPEDQYKLAKCYLTGDVFSKDTKAAKEWFLKASKNGHTLSQMALGDIYYNGLGVEKSYNEAMKWYTLAANGGEVSALKVLGDCYFRGTGVKQNFSAAINYYSSAAKHGENSAQEILGHFYYFGSGGVKVDYDEAFKWYLESAKNGNVEAAYCLAICYNEGKGTEANESKALKWITKAVDGGIIKGQGLYCVLTYNDAVYNMNKQSYSSAILGFTSLLKYDNTNIDAYLNRGYCYLNLQNKNYSDAEKDFRKVLELDRTNQTAINNLQIVIEHNNHVKEANDLCQLAYQSYNIKDYTNAIAYCAKSISLDNTKPYPYYLIGYCYYNCELYADAINFFNQALTVDPTYSDASKAIKSARLMGTLNAISKLATSVSNSLNNAYSNSINYSNSSNYKSTTSTKITTSKPSITKQKQVCSFCHGTGQNRTKEYPAEFGLGHSYKDTPCDVCGGFENHYHKTCPICAGKKYK